MDEEILKEANLEGSETVLALTNDDENNMMACVLAEKTGLKKRTIAIVNKTNYNLLQDSLNIDDLVDPRMTIILKNYGACAQGKYWYSIFFVRWRV